MLDEPWLATSAPIGYYNSQNKEWRASGAGVFITDGTYIWYVTALHVINDTSNPFVLIKKNDGTLTLVDLKSFHINSGQEWLVDKDNDLAASLFPMQSNFKIKAIPFNLQMKSIDVLPSMDCYSIGCPYTLTGFDIESNIHCVQKGIISGIDNKHGRIYVTVPTFPGNSGGPLLIWKQPMQTGGSLQLGPVVFLGGIISEYCLIHDDEELAPPFHLGVVIPSEKIQALVESKKATQLKQKALQSSK